MNKVLTAAILLLVICGTSSGEQGANPSARLFKLTLRMLEAPKTVAGKDQPEVTNLNRIVVVRENERFKVGQGQRRQFDDSGESQESGDRTEGKIKFSDSQTAIIDLKITVSSGRGDPEPSGAFLVTGYQYQIHSKVKLGEHMVIQLSKPDDDRQRWIEIAVTRGDR